MASLSSVLYTNLATLPFCLTFVFPFLCLSVTLLLPSFLYPHLQELERELLSFMLDIKSRAAIIIGGDGDGTVDHGTPGDDGWIDPRRDRWLTQFKTQGELSHAIHKAYTARLQELRKDILEQLARGSGGWVDTCNKIDYGNHFERLRITTSEAAKKKLALLNRR